MKVVAESNLVFSDIVYHLWRYWLGMGITPVRALKWGTSISLAETWPIISHILETVQDRR